MKKLSQKDKVIHDQFSAYGRNAKAWMNKCILMLPMIEKERIWEKKNFSSIYEYTAKLAGMSRHKVDDSLRIIRRLEDKPSLMSVASTKGLNAVRPVVTLATKETDSFWAGKAEKMSNNTLRVFAKDYKNENPQKLGGLCSEESRDDPGYLGNNGLGEPKSSEKVQVLMKLDKKTAEALKQIKGDGDWNDAIKKLLSLSEKELATERKKLEESQKQLQKELKEEKPEKVTNCTRHRPTKITKFIKKRSKGVCEHPNCNKIARHIHHIEPFALKKEHDPDKLIHICEEHHQLIHLGHIDESAQNPWEQVEKLPWYDVNNLINSNISKYSLTHSNL
jgi:hypothetical protein